MGRGTIQPAADSKVREVRTCDGIGGVDQEDRCDIWSARRWNPERTATCINNVSAFLFFCTFSGGANVILSLPRACAFEYGAEPRPLRVYIHATPTHDGGKKQEYI